MKLKKRMSQDFRKVPVKSLLLYPYLGAKRLISQKLTAAHMTDIRSIARMSVTNLDNTEILNTQTIASAFVWE